MKSIPFRSLFKIPRDIQEGMELDFEDFGRCKITKIKEIKFLDMRTMQVVGLCKPVGEHEGV